MDGLNLTAPTSCRSLEMAFDDDFDRDLSLVCGEQPGGPCRSRLCTKRRVYLLGGNLRTCFLHEVDFLDPAWLRRGLKGVWLPVQWEQLAAPHLPDTSHSPSPRPSFSSGPLSSLGITFSGPYFSSSSPKPRDPGCNRKPVGRRWPAGQLRSAHMAFSESGDFTIKIELASTPKKKNRRSGIIGSCSRDVAIDFLFWSEDMPVPVPVRQFPVQPTPTVRPPVAFEFVKPAGIQASQCLPHPWLVSSDTFSLSVALQWGSVGT